jgi:hypothetical protein
VPGAPLRPGLVTRLFRRLRDPVPAGE